VTARTDVANDGRGSTASEAAAVADGVVVGVTDGALEAWVGLGAGDPVAAGDALGVALCAGAQPRIRTTRPVVASRASVVRTLLLRAVWKKDVPAGGLRRRYLSVWRQCDGPLRAMLDADPAVPCRLPDGRGVGYDPASTLVRWTAWRLVATVLPILAVVVMTTKPTFWGPTTRPAARP
jgi:hypothetical protein